MSDSVQSTRGSSSCPTEVLRTRCEPESDEGLYFLPEMLILETATTGNEEEDDELFFIPFSGISGGGDGGPVEGGGGIPTDTTTNTPYGGFFDFAVETAEMMDTGGDVAFQEVIAPFDTLAIHLIAEVLVLETAFVGDTGSDVGFQEINNTGSFGSPPSGSSGGSPTVLTEF